jgi:hypothetical protein
MVSAGFDQQLSRGLAPCPCATYQMTTKAIDLPTYNSTSFLVRGGASVE